MPLALKTLRASGAFRSLFCHRSFHSFLSVLVEFAEKSFLRYW